MLLMIKDIWLLSIHKHRLTAVGRRYMFYVSQILFLVLARINKCTNKSNMCTIERQQGLNTLAKMIRYKSLISGLETITLFEKIVT